MMNCKFLVSHEREMGKSKKIYPEKYALLQIMESHIEGDKKLIDDVAIIREIDDSKEATRELVNAKPGTLVYHTEKDKIEVLIRKRVVLYKKEPLHYSFLQRFFCFIS